MRSNVLKVFRSLDEPRKDAKSQIRLGYFDQRCVRYQGALGGQEATILLAQPTDRAVADVIRPSNVR
jgi:hypothetical protein